jgi:5-methylthioadenosine/S-adenosylhomocysteine deaminase
MPEPDGAGDICRLKGTEAGNRQMRIEITNAHIICCDASDTEYANGFIVVENDRILDIGQGPSPGHHPDARHIKAGGKILLPGFVNGHTHSYANIMRGLTPAVPLEIWMVYAGVASQALAPRDIYLSTRLGGMEMIRTGTTTCVDHFHSSFGGEAMEQISRVYTDLGIRAYARRLLHHPR